MPVVVGQLIEIEPPCDSPASSSSFRRACSSTGDFRRELEPRLELGQDGILLPVWPHPGWVAELEVEAAVAKTWAKRSSQWKKPCWAAMSTTVSSQGKRSPRR